MAATLDVDPLVGWLGLGGGGRLVITLHSSNEPSELSQWLCLAMMTAL